MTGRLIWVLLALSMWMQSLAFMADFAQAEPQPVPRIHGETPKNDLETYAAKAASVAARRRYFGKVSSADQAHADLISDVLVRMDEPSLRSPAPKGVVVRWTRFSMERGGRLGIVVRVDLLRTVCRVQKKRLLLAADTTGSNEKKEHKYSLIQREKDFIERTQLSDLIQRIRSAKSFKPVEKGDDTPIETIEIVGLGNPIVLFRVGMDHDPLLFELRKKLVAW
jgi:hypothetical protein